MHTGQEENQKQGTEHHSFGLPLCGGLPKKNEILKKSKQLVM
jgi:hypothetical protein